jgi:hypothetical protein
MCENGDDLVSGNEAAFRLIRSSDLDVVFLSVFFCVGSHFAIAVEVLHFLSSTVEFLKVVLILPKPFELELVSF